jgi:hypothetical protein
MTVVGTKSSLVSTNELFLDTPAQQRLKFEWATCGLNVQIS